MTSSRDQAALKLEEQGKASSRLITAKDAEIERCESGVALKLMSQATCRAQSDEGRATRSSP